MRLMCDAGLSRVESNVFLVTAAANSIYSEVSAQTNDKVEDVTSCNSYARLFRSLSLSLSLGLYISI